MGPLLFAKDHAQCTLKVTFLLNSGMGPLLFAKDHAQCTLKATTPFLDTKSDTFKAMNPFAGVPCMKHGDLVLGESGAILRYLAEKCCPAAYPTELKRRTFIDFALERFASAMYADSVKTIYPILGYADAPEDLGRAATTCQKNLQSWADCFLKEKFVGGAQLSIADYKIAPFLLLYAHPAIRKVGVSLPTRMNQFMKDFLVACPNSKMLSEAAGWSLKEMADTKTEEVSKDLVLTPVSGPESTVDILKGKNNTGKDIKVCGVYASANCMGPLLVATSQSLGDLEPKLPYQDTSYPDFVEVNPFQQVPAIKDGEFTCGESSAILRYLGGLAKGETLYPADPQKRGLINWALDRFSTSMFSDVYSCIYPVLGYAAAPRDPEAAGKTCEENLESFAKVFLKETFVGGAHLSIADFKVAPFFYCYEHPAVCDQSSVKIAIPPRIKQFNADFKAKVGSTCFDALEKSADRSSLKELLDSKT